MAASEAEDPIRCHTDACERVAIVYLAGRPLCGEHYLANLNELNELGLTPRGLTEDVRAINGSLPMERRVRESVRPPERKRSKR